MTQGYGEIRCKFCRRWQRADFPAVDEESFLATAPRNAEQECSNPQCLQWIEAHEDNVRWHSTEGADKSKPQG
jgi:hypothetical protein